MTSRLFRTMVLAVLFWAASGGLAASEKHPPVEGSTLPEITLSAPKDPAHQAYLGVAGKKQFAVADIAAEVVIVQIFNMY